MTEVPEHLLARSRERRAALGLGGGGDSGGGSTPPPAAAASGEGVDPQEAPGRAPAPAAAATPAVVEEAPPPPPPPPYVQAALDRKKLPAYMGPVGVAIVLWAFIYAGVLFTSGPTITDPVLLEGQEIYAAQCSGCHGGQGQGASGRPLHDILETFPDPADHIAWVTNGSPAPGTVYGANGHVSQDGWPAMPGFGNALTEEQILAVVRYEREVMNGEQSSALASGEAPAGGGTEESGSSGGENTAEGDPQDTPTNEAETEGGDVGGDPSEEADLADGETETDADEGGSGDAAEETGREPDTGQQSEEGEGGSTGE